jgi:DNA-binding transcriptional MerR regulator
MGFLADSQPGLLSAHDPGDATPDVPRASGKSDEAVGHRGTTASAVAGITYRQLDYWDRTGLVTPSVRDADSGTQRLYSFRDLVVLKILKRLLDAGVTLQNIRKVIEALRQQGEDDLATMTLISDGNTVYQCRSPEEVVDLLQSGQGVFGIAIGRAFEEIQGSLAGLPAAPIDPTDWVPTDPQKPALSELRLAAQQYNASQEQLDEARTTLSNAIEEALRSGIPPAVVTSEAPVSAAWVRKLARDRDVPPAQRGPKPTAHETIERLRRDRNASNDS